MLENVGAVQVSSAAGLIAVARLIKGEGSYLAIIGNIPASIRRGLRRNANNSGIVVAATR